MFIKSLLPVLLMLATDLLNKKRNSKVVKWLVSEEVQNTVSLFFSAYVGAVADHEAQEDED